MTAAVGAVAAADDVEILRPAPPRSVDTLMAAVMPTPDRVLTSGIQRLNASLCPAQPWQSQSQYQIHNPTIQYQIYRPNSTSSCFQYHISTQHPDDIHPKIIRGVAPIVVEFVLSVFSKILERAMYFHSYSNLNERNILYKHRSRFIKKYKSTATTLIEAIDKTFKELYRGDVVVA